MPVQYAGIKKEHAAVRGTAGLFDVSHMGELHLTGSGALKAADRLITNDLATLEDGRALYTVCCNSRGTILDDLIVYRRSATDILVVCNAGNLPKITSHFAHECEGRCEFRDLSSETALLALQGPAARQILLAAGVSDAVADLAFFHILDGSIGGVEVSFARTGYTGEDGFEIFCAASDAVTLWRTLLAAGEPLGIAPVGLGARDTLRLEARLALYGNDIDETTQPFEAGLGWVVKLDAADFIGRDALRAAKASGLERKLVGFEMVGRGIARHGYPLVVDGQRVGEVTSGAPGITVGKNIGLGYVPPALSKIGTSLGVEIRDKVVEARVVKTPFYKRPK